MWQVCSSVLPSLLDLHQEWAPVVMADVDVADAVGVDPRLLVAVAVIAAAEDVGAVE